MMGLVEEEELDPQGQGHLAERGVDVIASAMAPFNRLFFR